MRATRPPFLPIGKHTRALGLMLALGLALSACASEPFVDDPKLRNTISKPRDVAPNLVDVCYHPDKATWEQLVALAEEECGRWGRAAHYTRTVLLQCRYTAPHIARFQCLKPGQRPGQPLLSDGTPDPHWIDSNEMGGAGYTQPAYSGSGSRLFQVPAGTKSSLPPLRDPLETGGRE